MPVLDRSARCRGVPGPWPQRPCTSARIDRSAACLCVVGVAGSGRSRTCSGWWPWIANEPDGRLAVAAGAIRPELLDPPGRGGDLVAAAAAAPGVRFDVEGRLEVTLDVLEERFDVGLEGLGVLLQCAAQADEQLGASRRSSSVPRRNGSRAWRFSQASSSSSRARRALGRTDRVVVEACADGVEVRLRPRVAGARAWSEREVRHIGRG